MAKECIEREAVYKFIFDIPNPNGAGEIEVVSVDDLESIPVADVVPVVRCHDCEFWERDKISCEGVARCRTGESGVRYRAKQDYCSRGIPKRKDSDRK